MTKQEQRVEEVRKEIASILCSITGDSFGYLDEETQNEEINRILSLKDKDGEPMLGIISDDQSLPLNPIRVTSHLGLTKEEATIRNLANDCLVNLVQQDMLAEGWRKILPTSAE